MTIGYGDWIPPYDCTPGVITIFSQSLTGVIMDAMFMGTW